MKHITNNQINIMKDILKEIKICKEMDKYNKGVENSLIWIIKELSSLVNDIEEQEVLQIWDQRKF